MLERRRLALTGEPINGEEEIRLLGVPTKHLGETRSLIVLGELGILDPIDKRREFATSVSIDIFDIANGRFGSDLPFGNAWIRVSIFA